jgi:hypothetical protein
MKERKDAHSAKNRAVLRPSDVCGFLAARRRDKKTLSIEEMDKGIAEAVRKRNQRTIHGHVEVEDVAGFLKDKPRARKRLTLHQMDETMAKAMKERHP